MQLQKEHAFIWCSEALGARERTSLTDHFLADGIEEPKSRDKILSVDRMWTVQRLGRSSLTGIGKAA